MGLLAKIPTVSNSHLLIVQLKFILATLTHMSMQAMKQGLIRLCEFFNATQVIIGLALLIISYVGYSKSTL